MMSIVATGVFEGVSSGFIADGWGASDSVEKAAAKLSDVPESGCIGRCSEPHGVCRDGVVKSPVEMLEYGRFRLSSGALLGRGLSDTNSLSISS